MPKRSRNKYLYTFEQEAEELDRFKEELERLKVEARSQDPLSVVIEPARPLFRKRAKVSTVPSVSPALDFTSIDGRTPEERANRKRFQEHVVRPIAKRVAATFFLADGAQVFMNGALMADGQGDRKRLQFDMDAPDNSAAIDALVAGRSLVVTPTVKANVGLETTGGG